MSEHIMIDLETTDTKFHAGVLTIGAVKFNIHTSDLLDKFYSRLGFDCARLFGTVDASTLVWWDKQDPTVKTEAFTGSDDPYQTATRLSQLGLESPWQWNVRDCRTVEDLAKAIGVYRRQWVRGGSHHNALDDAIYQAQYISGMWQSLTRAGRAV